jgi:hypothetical protein
MEQRELEARYAASAPRPIVKSAEEIAQERRTQLKANADRIRNQNVNLLLLAGDATPAEVEAVHILIERESAQHLGNADVYGARLMRLRAEGEAAISRVLGLLDEDVKQEVLAILATKGALASTGADGGAGAKAALAEYFER